MLIWSVLERTVWPGFHSAMVNHVAINCKEISQKSLHIIRYLKCTAWPPKCTSVHLVPPKCTTVHPLHWPLSPPLSMRREERTNLDEILENRQIVLSLLLVSVKRVKIYQIKPTSRVTGETASLLCGGSVGCRTWHGRKNKDKNLTDFNNLVELVSYS